MATYQDLLDVIAEVRARTGDPTAWTAGLSGADIAVVTNPMPPGEPGALDAVLARILAQHPGLSSARTTVPATATPPPGQQEGHAAEAIRKAETSLAQQNSRTAQLDLQVVAAVLNAHSVHSAGRAALDELQRDIETAVATRSDLDTPVGARGFQRYLIGKLRDIRTVVETAGLDATSKASLAAALASLYAASGPGATEPSEPDHPDAGQSPPTDTSGDAPVPAGPGADPLLDELLGTDPGGIPPDPPDQSPPMMAPILPAVPAAPATGGPGTPLSTGAPLGTGFTPPLPAASLGSAYPGGTEAGLADLLPGEPVDPLVADDMPARPTEEPGDQTGAEPVDSAEPDSDATTVRLPTGETIAAASPQLAGVIAAAVGGTPIAEAFRQHGITIPAPGSAVAHPVDPMRLAAGDIGMFTDRHALALGNGKAVFNNQIQPISSVTGPSFLGWEHPPGPDTTPPSTRSEPPTPTRPAVTAGPS